MVIALAIVLAQVKAEKPIPVPALPAGVEVHFSQLVSRIATHADKGEFKEATPLLNLLPKGKFKIQIDQTGVPARQKPLMVEALNRAIKDWSGRQQAIRPVLVTTGGDVKIAFNDVLAKPEGSALPAGVALFFSESPKEPRLEAVIGLRRGDPLVPTSLAAIENDMQFAIGSYLGFARAPFFGSVMSPTELPTRRPAQPDNMELQRAVTHLMIADKIRAAVASKIRIIPASPKMIIDPKSVEIGTVVQGKKINFQIQISNTGDGPLNLTLVKDCGCFSFPTTNQIPPHSSALLPAVMDSGEFRGLVKHQIGVVTNDPENPVQTVPFTVMVTPRFRFLAKENVLIGTVKGGAYGESYLYMPEGSPLEIESAQIDGLPGKVTFEPWEGVLADPDMKEPEMRRKGYKFTVDLDPMNAGRFGYTILARTTDKDFPFVKFFQAVQTGIVSLPDQVDLGDVPAARSGTFLVTRPGKPFKITKLECDSPFVELKSEAQREGSEYKVTASYNGKAGAGPINAMITVHTDDPDQPWMKIPFRANVR